MKENVFNEIVEWIESRLTINPSVEDIARGVGYSRRSVYNIFHEYAGLPVGKYIRMRRMTLAAGKLRLTHQPISSIACSLHFDSHQTFSREFKKAFGRCPSQYRHSAYWDMSALYQKVGPQGRQTACTLALFSRRANLFWIRLHLYALPGPRVSAPGKMSPGGKSRRKCRAASETSISSLNSHLPPIISIK
ncbi:transcriptional activator RamA [Klebsiella oxytoca]|nr:transcriptional activator RamA [Klebsiella oxytoca]